MSDFAFRWDSADGRWVMEVGYHGYLIAAIALQIAMCIAAIDALYVCSACSIPYARDSKRPKRGCANYCDACKAKGVDQRRSSQAYRERKTEAARLASGGTPLPEIAALRNASIAPVKRPVGDGDAE